MKKEHYNITNNYDKLYKKLTDHDLLALMWCLSNALIKSKKTICRSIRFIERAVKLKIVVCFVVLNK